MKTKNPNPTPADEIAALEQEVDFMKDRGREMGKAFTEAMLQITDQASNCNRRGLREQETHQPPPRNLR